MQSSQHKSLMNVIKLRLNIVLNSQLDKKIKQTNEYEKSIIWFLNRNDF